jgi:two-component system, cell cycle response regulator
MRPDSPDSKGPSPHSATQVLETAPRDRRRFGVLLVSSGHNAGKVLSIQTDEIVTLGRAQECTFAFDDAGLSREHARILQVGGDYVYKDAGSTNGSFINDVRITAAKRLEDGDRIQLGSGTILRFSLVDDAELQALQRVYNAAVRDGLTGVFNRKHLEERLDAEVAYALRQGTPLSIVILDVDHFKRVNDTYGHPGGDHVLKKVASVLAQTLRTEDVLARYGGEEFVIVARGLPGDQAVRMAERARNMLAQTLMSYDGKDFRITISAGVASLECCRDRKDKSTLLGTADGRLYRAKETGRNRVIGP